MATIAELLKKLAQGSASHRDLQEYASLLGNITGSNVSKAILEDKITGDDLLALALQLITEDYNNISDYGDVIQNGMYKAEGVGLKAIRPKLKKTDLRDAIETIESKEIVTEDYIASEIALVDQKIADRHMQANAEAADTAGLTATVSREYVSGGNGAHTQSKHPKTCTFCKQRETGGKMVPYAEAYANGIFQRHRNCRCIIEYVSKKGERTVQNGQSGWQNVTDGSTLQRRREYGADNSSLSAKERISKIPKINNVTAEYLKDATPGNGSLTKETGYNDKNHEEENSFAIWLHNILGGDIIQNKDSKTSGKHDADFWWRENLWELKTISSSKYNTFDQHVRDANKQIALQRGGFFIDISKGKLSINDAAELIERSMKNRNVQQTDVLIKKQDEYMIFRIG